MIRTRFARCCGCAFVFMHGHNDLRGRVYSLTQPSSPVSSHPRQKSYVRREVNLVAATQHSLMVSSRLSFVLAEHGSTIMDAGSISHLNDF